MINITEVQIRDAAERHVKLQYPGGVEKEYVIDDFTAGVEWAISQDQWMPVDTDVRFIFKVN